MYEFFQRLACICCNTRVTTLHYQLNFVTSARLKTRTRTQTEVDYSSAVAYFIDSHIFIFFYALTYFHRTMFHMSSEEEPCNSMPSHPLLLLYKEVNMEPGDLNYE